MYELKDYLNAINYTKENLLDTEDEQWEKKYFPFIVNKCVTPFPDTIMLVNEINQLHHLDKKLQFDFLINSLRSRKRYAPWMKAKKLEKCGLYTVMRETIILCTNMEPQVDEAYP